MFSKTGNRRFLSLFVLLKQTNPPSCLYYFTSIKTSIERTFYGFLVYLNNLWRPQFFLEEIIKRKVLCIAIALLKCMMASLLAFADSS